MTIYLLRFKTIQNDRIHTTKTWVTKAREILDKTGIFDIFEGITGESDNDNEIKQLNKNRSFQ